MPGYAIGHLRNVRLNTEIIEYLERIDATLDPYEGRFLIHGGTAECKEGAWSGDIIVIAFPSMERARAWYASPAYQEIAPLRARNADGEILLIEGNHESHRATETAAELMKLLC